MHYHILFDHEYKDSTNQAKMRGIPKRFVVHVYHHDTKRDREVEGSTKVESCNVGGKGKRRKCRNPKSL